MSICIVYGKLTKKSHFNLSHKVCLTFPLSIHSVRIVLFADSWSYGGQGSSSSRLENLESIRESKLVLTDYNLSLQPERKSKRLRVGKEVASICSEKPRASKSEKGTRGSEELSPSVPSSPFIILPSTVSHPKYKVPLRIVIPPVEKNSLAPPTEQAPREGLSPTHVSELVKDSARVLHYLVVDDVMMNRRMVHRVLSSYRHKVSEATDGKDCLRVWEEITAAGGAVDVVLMDNSMPIMTGQQLSEL